MDLSVRTDGTYTFALFYKSCNILHLFVSTAGSVGRMFYSGNFVSTISSPLLGNISSFVVLEGNRLSAPRE
jgi:hypothetical protein